MLEGMLLVSWPEKVQPPASAGYEGLLFPPEQSVKFTEPIIPQAHAYFKYKFSRFYWSVKCANCNHLCESPVFFCQFVLKPLLFEVPMGKTFQNSNSEHYANDRYWPQKSGYGFHLFGNCLCRTQAEAWTFKRHRRPGGEYQ